MGRRYRLSLSGREDNICHDQPCERGETSTVAHLYDLDEPAANLICDTYNNHKDPARYLAIIKEAFEL